MSKQKKPKPSRETEEHLWWDTLATLEACLRRLARFYYKTTTGLKSRRHDRANDFITVLEMLVYGANYMWDAAYREHEEGTSHA